MTMDEINAYIEGLASRYRKEREEYNKQQENKTSVQRERSKFNKDFYDNALKRPLMLDDIFTVIDVQNNSGLVMSFWLGQLVSKKCYLVVTDKLQFNVKLSSGADKLNKGQRIRVTGYVTCEINSLEYTPARVQIKENTFCALTFQIIK